MEQSTLKYYRLNAPAAAERYESANVKELHGFLMSGFSPGDRILEIGCGSGRDAAFMRKQGFTVTATDGSASMVAQACLYHPELAGNVRQLKLPEGLSVVSGRFEGVYAVAVLMHLSRKEIENSISRIYSLLTSNGKFIFSVPVERDDIERDDFDAKGRRFTAFSQDEWENLCVKYDFHIARTMISTDGLGRGGIVWMNCLAQKF